MSVAQSTVRAITEQEVLNLLSGPCSSGILVGPRQYTEEWYSLRRLSLGRSPEFVIGASDSPVIAGDSRWKTPLKLWKQINGLEQQVDPTIAMQIGKALEPTIAHLVAEEIGEIMLHDIPIVMRQDLPWMGASIDAVSESGTLFELKCSQRFRYDKTGCDQDMFGPDSIPRDYFTQVQHQMCVTGKEEVVVAVLFDQSSLRFYRIKRDEDKISSIIAACRDFVDCVISQKQPDAHEDDLDDIRADQHSSMIPGTHAIVDHSAEMLIEEMIDTKSTMRRMKTRVKEIETILIEMMGDCEQADVEGSSYTLKRVHVEPTLWTASDVSKAEEQLGQIKRRGFTRLLTGER